MLGAQSVLRAGRKRVGEIPSSWEDREWGDKGEVLLMLKNCTCWKQGKKKKNRSQRLNRVNSVSCSYYMSSARQWEALIHTVMQGTRLTENLSSCSCAIWTPQHLWLLQKGKKEVEEDACQLLTVSARQ